MIDTKTEVFYCDECGEEIEEQVPIDADITGSLCICDSCYHKSEGRDCPTPVNNTPTNSETYMKSLAEHSKAADDILAKMVETRNWLRDMRSSSYDKYKTRISEIIDEAEELLKED